MAQKVIKVDVQKIIATFLQKHLLTVWSWRFREIILFCGFQMDRFGASFPNDSYLEGVPMWSTTTERLQRKVIKRNTLLKGTVNINLRKQENFYG